MDASVAVLHAVVKWQVCPITGPIQSPLIKIADNGVSACMAQHVVIKFLVSEGVKLTVIYRRLQAQHSTVQ